MAYLIGTAGHVDHGKTSLVKALTGIDADRLPEEQARGMTIEVGFAYIDLPDVGRVSIVDVPGHEKLLHNMLVGAQGIDLALLVVAADEGVMPQTKEHLDILTLLPVKRLVVALTRTDLADEDTLAVSQLEARELVDKTRFAGSPLLPVSVKEGTGTETLRAALRDELIALAEGPAEPPSPAPWYLPIDRVFSVKGHGVVVTGTLARGSVTPSTAVLQPGGREVRIRQIQVHGESVACAEKGQRTALNLSGAEIDQVVRGMTVGAVGAAFESSIFDAEIRWLHRPRHGTRVRVSVGADEGIGRVFFTGDESFGQFRLDSRISVSLGQPVIVRYYSPPELLGGGVVVTPQGRAGKRKASSKDSAGTSTRPTSIVEAVGAGVDGKATEEICRVLGRSRQELGTEFEKRMESGELLGFAGVWFQTEAFERGVQKFLDALKSLHKRNPQVATIARERVVSGAGLTWAGKPLDRIIARLAQDERIVVQGTHCRLPEFRVALTPRQRQFLDRVKETLEAAGMNTPYLSDLSRSVVVPRPAVEEILKLGVQSGELVMLSEEILYTTSQIETLKHQVREIAGTKPFSAATMRDAIGTSRKYIIPLLEYFDTIRFTTRVGDERVVNRLKD